MIEVIRLEPGHDEPEGEDFVKVEATPSGGSRFTGTVGFNLVEVSPGDPTPNAADFMTGEELPTAYEAEVAGIAWAQSRGSVRLYVLPAEPFEDEPERISDAPEGTMA